MQNKFLLFIILFTIGCNSASNKTAEKTVVSKDSTSIADENIIQSPDPTKEKNKKPNIDLLKSPVGLTINTGDGASTLEQISFYLDSIVLYSRTNDYLNWSIGKWYMIGDSIIMKFHKEIRQRGIGKPVSSTGIISAEGPYEEFAENVFDVTIIEERYVKIWSEIKRNIKNGLDELEDWNISYDSSKYDLKVNGDYTFVSTKKLVEDDLVDFDKKELRLMRNEVFARYGYKFKSKDLYDHFYYNGWYEPKRENVDQFLSNLEKENIKLIEGLEKRK
jgi:hypothetical protein